MWAIRPEALRSNPTAHEMSVASTTTISTPGSLGAKRFISHISAMAPTPIASVGK